MPLIRLNLSADNDQVLLHGSVQCVNRTLGNAGSDAGPIIIMVHGYKYDPGLASHCPHRSLFDAHHGWPAELRPQCGNSFFVCVGWPARGPLNKVFATARQLGGPLAQVIATLRRAAPYRPIHIIAHSMGAEIALSALGQSAAKSITRVVLIAGASFQDHATEALMTPAGHSAEIVNITSRENDVFDFMFETLLRPPTPKDRAIGQGISAPNALNIQLDCADTLAALARMGCAIAPAQRRVCHWSGYTRPGAMAFYARLLASPDALSLEQLTARLPLKPAARWSRLPLAGLVKMRIMSPNSA